jgi:hypothetical protein
MRRLSRFRPSPALVIACVALFVSLGGVSYGIASGAITSRAIKNNTVSSKDIKNLTITAKDVKKNSLGGTSIRESRLGKVPNAAHADTADAADTADTATNATNATNAGNATTVGGLNPSGFLRSDGEARTGTTLRGVYNITGGAAGSGAASLGTGDISFGLRFATAPTVRLIATGGVPPTGCSGTSAAPVASPGFVCVFDIAASNAGALNNNTSTRQGVTLFFSTTAGGAGFHAGNWAATAP